MADKKSLRNDIILSVKNLNKSFNEKVVLKDLSFDLHKGEILGILGSSGCGKTTLLKCIDLLEDFQEGEIVYNDKWKITYSDKYINIINNNDDQNNEIDINKQIIKIRQLFGFVFQSFNLWEEKKVINNLILGPTVVQNKLKRDAIEEATELADQFGLKNKLYSKGWELSGGQKQRVAIIRALLMHPQIMLLDEITSALDPVLTYDVLQSVRKLREKGLSMIVVTHHIEFATSLCDRLLFLSDGKVIQNDTPHNIRNNPTTDEVKNFLQILKSTN